MQVSRPMSHGTWKRVGAGLIAWWILSGGAGLAQPKALPVDFAQLLAHPEQYDKKQVSVSGFIRIWHEPRHSVRAVLYLRSAQAENLSGQDGVLVKPNHEMVQDWKGLDRMHVLLTGVFRATPSGTGRLMLGIDDIRACRIVAGG